MLHWWYGQKQRLGCATERLLLSARWSVSRILGRVPENSADAWELSEASALLKQLPSPAMPPHLALLVRQRIREERRKNSRPTLLWKLRTEFAHLTVPAAVGLLSAVIIFGSFIRLFEIPVHANSQDVPLALRTPPRPRSGPLVDANNGIDCMVVSILIDQNGRVADFHVVKGKQTPEQMRQLESVLLFSQFDPATVFGKPTPDTVTLKLRDGQLKANSL